MTRIIGGALGSLRLKGPAKATRPTSDRVKESTFSILESMDAIQGARVLDLFAGTGALGLEAASRGASKVTLVERDRFAAAICEENLERVTAGLDKTGLGCEFELHKKSAEKFLIGSIEVSLVFLDPPYEMKQGAVINLLASIQSRISTLIVLERPGKEKLESFPEGFNHVRVSNFGDTVVYFLSKPADPKKHRGIASTLY